MICGTVGKGVQLEAIRITLHNLDGYHVYYCSYVKGMGWQAWVRDGETSGTEGQSLPLEAVRIRIARSTVCLILNKDLCLYNKNNHCSSNKKYSIVYCSFDL